MKYISLSLISLIVLLNACSSRRPVQHVDLAEVTVKPAKINHYYPAYTRTIDIIHTKLDISLNWDSSFVNGKAQLKARPYFYATNEIILDAKGFQINDVKLNGKKVDYEYDQRKLKIKLDRRYNKDESFNIYIDYVAMPNKLKVDGSAAISSDKGFYFINPDGKDQFKPKQFWTQGETEASSCWFPTVESTSERFTQEISITVDTSMVTLSNGRLAYSTKNSNGTRTDYWRQDLTHAPYLVMLAGGNFKIYKDKWRDMEVNYYMEPLYAPYAKNIFGNTPEMLEFFSKKLNYSYPWDKYSQIVIRDFVSGAMENTTASTFYDALNMTDRDLIDRSYDGIIAHELFHHWFGDLVTAESWPNLPLNESFADYGEYLWFEHKYGRDEADKINNDALNSYLGSAKLSRVDMIRFNVTDREEMFDANSYEKGGRILHMLRKYMGDDAFFSSLKLYLETNQYKPVEIHHLRMAFEEITGEDLNWFFNQWFMTSGHAEMVYEYAYDEVKKQSVISIKQEQDLKKNPLYKLPIDIDIYVNGKASRHRVILDSVQERFIFPLETKPDLINADADKIILGTKTDKHTTEEWIYMYKHAPLFMDRYEALRALAKINTESSIQNVFISALNDKVNTNRNLALDAVNSFSSENKKATLEKIKIMALSDKKSNVRSKALEILAEQFPETDHNEVYSKAEKDSSYAVLSTLIKIYGSKDKERAMKIAKAEEQTQNAYMRISISELYAKEGTSAENSFYTEALKRSSGYSPMYIIPSYRNYLKRMDDNVIREGLPIIKNLATNATLSGVKRSAKSLLRDMQNSADSEELKNEIKNFLEKEDQK